MKRASSSRKKSCSPRQTSAPPSSSDGGAVPRLARQLRRSMHALCRCSPRRRRIPVLFIQNLARWSATPPALLTHLLKQPVVRQNIGLRKMLLKHRNVSSESSASSGDALRSSRDAAHVAPRASGPGRRASRGCSRCGSSPCPRDEAPSCDLAIAVARGHHGEDLDSRFVSASGTGRARTRRPGRSMRAGHAPSRQD